MIINWNKTDFILVLCSFIVIIIAIILGFFVNPRFTLYLNSLVLISMGVIGLVRKRQFSFPCMLGGWEGIHYSFSYISLGLLVTGFDVYVNVLKLAH